MVRLRRALIVAVVVGTATMAVREPAAQQANLADAIIPVGYAIPLSTPVTSVKTTGAIDLVLRAAGVPFGIEGPARGEPPGVDLAQPRVEVANLHGLSVAAALGAIARLDPSVHWSEADGVIDVRLTSGPTWIDQEMPPFSISNADAAQSLDALVGAIDPARGHVTPFGAVLGADVVRIPPVPPQPTTSVTLTQARGTVLQGLNALVRGTRRSWRITYDGSATDAIDASIVFAAADASVESASSLAQAERADANLVRVRIDTRVDFAIADFARLAHVPLSIESVPAPALHQESENIPLSLDRRDPRAALDRLLAYDSRYTLIQAHGMFRVQPRGGSTVPALDQPVVDFSVTNEPFQTALNRVLGRGVTRPTSTATWATSAANQVFETPISVTANGSTVRDLLDAICHAIDVDWSVEPMGGGSVLLTVRAPGTSLVTSTSWRSTADTTVVAREHRASAVPVTLKSLQLSLPQAMASVAMPFGAYLRDVTHTPGEERAALAAEAQAPAFVATGDAAPQVLARLLEKFPGLEWNLDGAVYHIRPTGPVDTGDIMNRKIAAIDYRVPDLQRAATYMIDAIVPRSASQPWLPMFTVDTFAGRVRPTPPPPNTGPIHIVFGGGTVRDALDAVTRTHNTPSWILWVIDTGQGRSVTLTLCSAGGTDCRSSGLFGAFER